MKNKRNNRASMEMYKRYLLKEQGYDERVVNEMSYEELQETYDYYHEEM